MVSGEKKEKGSDFELVENKIMGIIAENVETCLSSVIRSLISFL